MTTTSEHITPVTDQDTHETLAHLRELIRINTTNPPGNESEACRYLARIFRKENIPFKILESAPGRSNIIARLKGDQSLAPLLLTSHLDVVPCEKDLWTVDPFAAEIKDNMIWGRGVIDMKNMTAMELMIFLKAHRNNIPLKRDLIFAAVADEESGGEHGSKWLVNSHPELIQAEYALNEVGGFNLEVDNQTFYPIGVAEKGLCRLRIIARGNGGHSSLPCDNQAIAKIGLAAHMLATTELPFHTSKPASAFIEALAQEQQIGKKILLKGIRKQTTSTFILNKVFPDKQKARNFYNMFHNLATPTIIRGGSKENVIPSQAEMFIDGRIVPEQTVDSFIQEIKKVIGPQYDIEIIKADNPVSTPYDNDFFKQCKTSLELHDPGAVAIPFLIPGFTDAQAYSRIGIKCYGFAPVKLLPDMDFGKLFHGHDERLPISSLDFGVKVLWDVITETCL